jgi:hypothetical protein
MAWLALTMTFSSAGQPSPTGPDANLAPLPERSKPSADHTVAIDSFGDILRLRDSRDPKAVPILERVLEDNLHTTRIHEFAAAQALFSIGTPEAHAALARILFTNWPAMQGLDDAQTSWPFGLAIDYTSHWKMPEPQRSRFIQDYLLKNLSTNLVLELGYRVVFRKETARVEFSLTFRNNGRNPISIPEFDEWCLGRLLFFREPSGTFWPHVRPGGGDNSIKMLVLKAGDAKEFKVSELLARSERYRREGYPATPDASLVLDGATGTHFVKEGEDYEVTAMFEVERRPDWRIPSDGRNQAFKDAQGQAWAGRVSSKPVKIKFPTLTAETVPK